jgi:hypothetical protein
MTDHCDLNLGPHHYSARHRWWLTVSLFCRTVFRDQLSPSQSWTMARGIWKDCACYDCNPGKRERWTGQMQEKSE